MSAVVKRLRGAIALIAIALGVFATASPPAGASVSSLLDCGFGPSQVFDVQYWFSGTLGVDRKLNISGVTRPWSSNGPLQASDIDTDDQFAFVNSTGTPGTLGFAQFDGSATLKRTLHDTGSFRATGPGFVFYLGSGFYGTVVTTQQAFAYGSSAQLDVDAENVSDADALGFTSCSAAPVLLDAAPTAWSDTALGTVQVGEPFSLTVTADGSPAPTYSITAGALPAGLSLDTATGAITGTPTDAGPYSFELTATNSEGSIATTFTGTVDAAAVAPTLTPPAPMPAFVTGVPVTATFTATGNPTPTFSVTAGSLPDGLSLDATTGVLSGTPVATGAFSFQVSATNSAGTDTSDHEGEVMSVPTTFSSAGLGDLLVGGAVNLTVTADGSPAPTYSITAGALPAGLTLDGATGAITGTPTTPGEYTFELTATNAAGSASATFAGTVDLAPSNWSHDSLGGLVVGDAFDLTVTAQGSPAPTYSITDGALPDGLTLDPATGAITGTPTTAGSYSFELTATNLVGSAAITLTGTVEAAPVAPGDIDPANLPVFTVGTPVSVTLTSTGAPTPTFTLTGGTLPAGLTFDPTTGTVSGTPTAAGDYTFEVTATNSAGSTTRTYQGTVESEETPGGDEATDLDLTLSFVAGVNVRSGGATSVVRGSGLTPGAPYTITLRSTPRVLATGVVAGDGTISTEVTIPADVEAGAHSITVSSTGPDGPVDDVAWFAVDESGVVTGASTVAPVPAPTPIPTPVPTPTPTPTPAPTVTDPVPANLPRTGVDASALIGIAGLLLQAGGAAELTARRMRARARVARTA